MIKQPFKKIQITSLSKNCLFSNSEAFRTFQWIFLQNLLRISQNNRYRIIYVKKTSEETQNPEFTAIFIYFTACLHIGANNNFLISKFQLYMNILEEHHYLENEKIKEK